MCTVDPAVCLGSDPNDGHQFIEVCGGRPKRALVWIGPLENLSSKGEGPGKDMFLSTPYKGQEATSLLSE